MASRNLTQRLEHPPVVLLDRDGVLNDLVEGDYVRTPAGLHMRPGAAAAVRRLNDAGITVFVVTNQRGVARGLMSISDLDAVHDQLRHELKRAGARVDGIYACTHDNGACSCRKPLPGLVTAIRTDHPELDLTAAVMVGDSWSDIEMARAAGLLAIRVADVFDPLADATVPSLTRAVDVLLGENTERPGSRLGAVKPPVVRRTRVDDQVKLLHTLLVIDVIGQRLAIPVGSTSQIPVGLVAGVAVTVIGMRRGLMRCDQSRLRLALIAMTFLSTSALVVAASGTAFSFLSLGLLIATYIPFIAMIDGDGAAVFRRLLEKFVRLMGGLAIVTLLQTGVQFVGVPRGDLLSQILPTNILLTGYHTTFPFYYGSPYDKANGIVFLEPSFCSQYLALGLLAHLWLRRRGPLPLLLLGAMVVTVAGTGFVLLGFGLLAIAVRGERVRGQSPVLRALLPAIVAGVVLAATTSLGSIFVSRLNEGTSKQSSTGERFFQPFTTLGRGWLDSSFDALVGHGPGSALRFLSAIGGDNIVPLAPLKLLYEYGAIAALPALLLVFWSCISGARATPLTTGLLVSWVLLSGSLQQPATVLILWLFTSACARPSEIPLAPIRNARRTAVPAAVPLAALPTALPPKRKVLA